MSETDVCSAADKPSYLAPTSSIAEGDLQFNWSREFTVLGRHTLEQLNEIILHILGWDRCHLYEFRIADRVYAHMVFLEEDDLFVEAEKPCVSCDITIRRIGLSVGDTFVYIYDFGDHHIFRVTVLDIRPAATVEVVPVLLAYRGTNIVQYPGTMGKADARAFMNRAPTVAVPEPARDRFRIRFVRDTDGSVLREWRASNNKTHWQKAVTILESRNLSLENIAKEIEQTEGNVERWIKAFNRFGLEGINKPDGRRGSTKSPGRERRAAVRDEKARRILEIIHAKPSAYGINRSNWTHPSIARAYEQEHNETISTYYAGQLLRRSGYGIRKARKVLTSPDPNYREKVDLLLTTLQNLKPRELFFFFVDELGPLRVKKYGGRALVRKNEVLTFPQDQAHRGVIMMSGALSATSNQVTWVYGRAKDTVAMIDLMELLYNQYFSAPKLYVTWDAASWHKSAMLVEWLDAFNSTTKRTSDKDIRSVVDLCRELGLVVIDDPNLPVLAIVAIYADRFSNIVTDDPRMLYFCTESRAVHLGKDPRSMERVIPAGVQRRLGVPAQHVPTYLALTEGRKRGQVSSNVVQPAVLTTREARRLSEGFSLRRRFKSARIEARVRRTGRHAPIL